MVPGGVVGLVVVAVSNARDAEPADAASSRSANVTLNFVVNVMKMRRSDIYCTPVGLAEASEMAAGGSFG